ncbi:thermophilic desulfurizing enzyme family protein [Microthyrium microscopicum]|uniref:Thermophilic desulfurizing enzyme family protein n=1 Tax=Microthyrium microscopicum TaxID=703497 RepID=A0A6A6UA95_9PEZI|nr:thermophilic desulfurizing enzyme family protein [Microthyrium microscopicum]
MSSDLAPASYNNNGKHLEHSQQRDLENQHTRESINEKPSPKTLGAGTALAIGAFGTTLTTLSLSLMEWRGVTTTNVYVANFFFIAAFGLVVTAQWELAVGNGFAYTVFSAFGLFYAGYAAILTPSFGIAAAYGTDTAQYNNALGFFMILWTVFVLMFFIASLPTNLVYILVFFFVDVGFLTVAASYFAAADGNAASATGLKKAGGAFCFIAGLIGWYLTLHLLIKDSIVELPLGDTSRFFGRKKKNKYTSSEVPFQRTLFNQETQATDRFVVILPTASLPPALLMKGYSPKMGENGLNVKAVRYTDPSTYDSYKSQWESLPENHEQWVARAREVAHILLVDAVKRDQENKSPLAEIALLKHAGLLKVLGPKKYGGGGQPWSAGYAVIREVAKADGSLGMLLGYHLLWSTTANVVGTREQAERVQELIISKNYFVGGAVNPRDADLKITNDGEGLVFNGFKHFNTGGVVSDLTVLEGVYEDTDNHIFAIVETNQSGIQFLHNWDNVGLRLTESGSVKIANVRVPWSDALGWDASAKAPIAEILTIPFGSLLLPTIQLVFSNFYLGIAIGALEYGAKYTQSSTRAWPYGGDNKEKATDEFYILERYGNYFAHLRAAEALADRAGERVSSIYAAHSETRSSLTAELRGELAEWVASVKVVTTDVGLQVTSGVFEVTGAKATASKVGLDRFWRDIRTHTLHDPVAYKNRELGKYVLLQEAPEPTWYT